MVNCPSPHPGQNGPKGDVMSAMFKQLVAASFLSLLGAMVLFIVPAHAHGGHESSVADGALPRFAATAGRFELAGVLQPAEAGRQTRELLLHLKRNDGDGPLDAVQLEVALGELTLQARANGDGSYALILPAGLSGQVELEVRIIDQGALSGTVTAELNLDEDVHTEPEATKKRGGPLPQVYLMGVLTLVIFFISGLLAWREHRGRKGKRP